MKRSVFVVVLIFLLTSIVSVYGEGIGQAYEGGVAYKSLQRNSAFTDVKGHFAKKSIYKMSSLSVIRGLGKTKFNPNGYLTKEDAITYLIRLKGLEAEAQGAGEKMMEVRDTGKYNIIEAKDYWMSGYIKVAQNNKIVSREEIKKLEKLTDIQKESIEEDAYKRMKPYIKDTKLTEVQLQNIETSIIEKLESSYHFKKAVNREELALWIGRTLELEPISGEEQQTIYALKDFRNIKTENIGMIEAILQRGIMKGNKNGYFHPKGTVSRGEMAVILDKISDQMLTKRGFKILSGTVENIEAFVTSEQDVEGAKFVGIENRVFTINNEDASYINIIAKESSIPNLNRGFLVYRNGYLGSPKYIKENDNIKYFIDNKGNVVFIEVE